MLYKDYASFLARFFETKVQKISIDAGFTCPNIDGTVARGGCTYCNNRSFHPDYCQPAVGVRKQLEEGIRFFARKYPAMRYLAYFQAYSNTYAPLDRLRELYEEALRVEGVVGLVIGTRPDCVPDEVLDYLQRLSQRTFVLVEYGIESVKDETLRRINRGHDFACAADAVRRTAARGLPVGVHTIIGLPGETHDDFLRQAEVISSLPVDVLKLHQLQLVKGTRMAREYREHPEDFRLFTPEEYADTVLDYLERLRDDIVVERFTNQSPPDMLAVPGWGLKNFEFLALLEKRARLRQKQ